MAEEGEGGGEQKEDERRGTKRSAKDRLGHKRTKLDRLVPLSVYFGFIKYSLLGSHFPKLKMESLKNAI